jgi:hypothetical protein
MNRVYNITISFVICFNAASLVCGNLIDTQSCIVYYGMSDASAAVALGEDVFVAADDENNILRIYKTNQTSGPVSTFDLTSFIMADSTYPEADIEGATILGERIYWITSHGRNKDGKMRPTRYRLFATSVKKENETITLTPFGIPCRTLIYDMLGSNMTRGLRLDKVTKLDVQKITKKELRELAPKRKGLNIEGLCATPDGNSLYIGLRNPQFPGWVTLKKRAIIVPLLNPRQVIENGESAIFGTPILLDLNGLGIRSIEYSCFHKSYLIIAGPKDDKPGFALYKWSGEKEEKPVLLKKFPKNKNFTPEALVVFENSGKLLVLSDDGTINIDISDSSRCLNGKTSGQGKCPNKFLSDQSKKHFRGTWLEL